MKQQFYKSTLPTPKRYFSGIPRHIYEFPEQYQAHDYGMRVRDEDLERLKSLDELAPLFDGSLDDYIPSQLRIVCDRFLQNMGINDPKEIIVSDAGAVFTYLKSEVIETYS